MQVPQFLIPLERQTMRGEAVRRDKLHALFERTSEVRPGAPIKLLDGLMGSCEPLHLAAVESLEQPLTERIT
jgi:hypothetical protein